MISEKVRKYYINLLTIGYGFGLIPFKWDFILNTVVYFSNKWIFIYIYASAIFHNLSTLVGIFFLWLGLHWCTNYEIIYIFEVIFLTISLLYGTISYVGVFLIHGNEFYFFLKSYLNLCADLEKVFKGRLKLVHIQQTQERHVIVYLWLVGIITIASFPATYYVLFTNYFPFLNIFYNVSYFIIWNILPQQLPCWVLTHYTFFIMSIITAGKFGINFITMSGAGIGFMVYLESMKTWLILLRRKAVINPSYERIAIKTYRVAQYLNSMLSIAFSKVLGMFVCLVSLITIMGSYVLIKSHEDLQIFILISLFATISFSTFALYITVTFSFNLRKESESILKHFQSRKRYHCSKFWKSCPPLSVKFGTIKVEKRNLFLILSNLIVSNVVDIVLVF